MGRLLAVTGVVAMAGIDPPLLEVPEVVLSGSLTDQARSVDCVFDPRLPGQVVAIADGDTVTLFGVCSGYAEDAFVPLVHCQPAAE